MTETNAQRSIGRLEGKLDALIETVREQGERSDASRSRLYESVDRIAREQSRQDSELKDIRKIVARVEPAANRFLNLEQRGLAVVAVVTVIWIFIGGAVSSGITNVFAWVAKAISTT